MTPAEQQTVSVVIAGIGGYGHYYLKTLLNEFPQGRIRLAGVVDPCAEECALYPAICSMNVPVYPDMEQFYEDTPPPHLALIVSPPHFHLKQSLSALTRQTSVLCDKPLCPTVDEADAFVKAEQESDAWAMIGYQWSWSRAVLRLKEDIIKGKYGRPLRARTICLWPRGFDYYHRNSWAGRIRTDSQEPVFDSPANNAAAHFLHNLLFLLGDKMDRSARPATVEAALFRAYPIENFDTISCKIETETGYEICFHASHVTEKCMNPCFEIDFSEGRVYFESRSKDITGIDSENNEIHYGDPDRDQFGQLCLAIAGAGKEHTPVCGPAAARSQTETVNIIQNQASAISPFPADLLDQTDELIRVRSLYERLTACYKQDRLLTF